ncbi:MAG: acyl-CoA thioesterase [Spirochaetales bacterium]|nr:MAG: acyl-CoA thioesterase [Spirochaetales bacterium]
METSEITVRGYHLDQHGHVNNIRYMEFLEEGRYVFLDKHAGQIQIWKERGLTLFVVNININYRKPSFLGDILEIRSGIIKVGKKSGVIHQDMFRRGTTDLIVDADVTFVVFDTHRGKALPVEGLLQAELLAMAGPDCT